MLADGYAPGTIFPPGGTTSVAPTCGKHNQHELYMYPRCRHDDKVARVTRPAPVETRDAMYMDYLEKQLQALQVAFETSSVISDRILHQGAAWHTTRRSKPHADDGKCGDAGAPAERKSPRSRSDGRRVRFDDYVIIYVMTDEGHVGTLSEPTNFEPRNREAYITRCLSRSRVGGPEPEDEQDYDNLASVTPHGGGQGSLANSHVSAAAALDDSGTSLEDEDDTYDDLAPSIAAPATDNIIYPGTGVLAGAPIEDPAENLPTDPAALERPPQSLPPAAVFTELRPQPPPTTAFTPSLPSPPTAARTASPVFKFDKDPVWGLCISFSLPLGGAYSTKDIVVQTSDTTTIRVVASSVAYETFDRHYSLPMAVETSMVDAKRDREGNLIITAPLLGGKLARG